MNTPSDEEIVALARSEGIKVRTGAGVVKLARAVLAKWGTPQPENLGFTIENRAGADVVVWKEGGCRPATSAEIAMWKALSAVQQPVAREQLTDAQIQDLLLCGNPTDAELEALLLDKLPASKHYIRPVIEKMVAAMQAAIDKWGQPVAREQLSANQVSGLAESAGYWHGDMSRADFINGIRYAEAAHGIKGGQHG